MGSAFTTSSGVLHFAYLEETNAKTVHVELLDITKSKQSPVQLDSSDYRVTYGDNLLNLDLRDISGMINKHIYMMELINARQERWFLKFEYLKQD